MYLCKCALDTKEQHLLRVFFVHFLLPFPLDAMPIYPGTRMQEAWEQHQFQRLVEDELVWAKEAETLLGTEDIGKDLQGVRFLLKNHQVKDHYNHHFTLHIFHSRYKMLLWPCSGSKRGDHWPSPQTTASP